MSEHKIGDLVKFESSFFNNLNNSEYANPGVVIAVRDASVEWSGHTRSYTVVWNDGRVTNEWHGYLKKLA